MNCWINPRFPSLSPPPNSLFIEKLPKHPDYAKATMEDKSRIKKLLKEVFPRAMELKNKLQDRFEVEKEERERQLKEEVSTTIS